MITIWFGLVIPIPHNYLQLSQLVATAPWQITKSAQLLVKLDLAVLPRQFCQLITDETGEFTIKLDIWISIGKNSMGTGNLCKSQFTTGQRCVCFSRSSRPYTSTRMTMTWSCRLPSWIFSLLDGMALDRRKRSTSVHPLLMGIHRIFKTFFGKFCRKKM